MTEEFSE